MCGLPRTTRRVALPTLLRQADGVNPGFLVVVTPNTPVRCRPGRGRAPGMGASGAAGRE